MPKHEQDHLGAVEEVFHCTQVPRSCKFFMHTRKKKKSVLFTRETSLRIKWDKYFERMFWLRNDFGF